MPPLVPGPPCCWEEAGMGTCNSGTTMPPLLVNTG